MSGGIEGPGIVGLPYQNVKQLLWRLSLANMQSANVDQIFQKMFSGTTWDPTEIVAYWVSGAFNVACSGGVYSGAGKTGSAIVAVGQSYAGLGGANQHVVIPVQATAVAFNVPPILNLTTGNTGALIADIRIYGNIVS